MSNSVRARSSSSLALWVSTTLPFSASQRGVLLDVLAVLVERGGADAVQLAARQRRLQQVGGVHRALRLAGADQGVHLVDEEDDLALGLGHLGQHALQTLLELAAVLRAGDHG